MISTYTGTAHEQWALAAIDVALGRITLDELHELGTRLLKLRRDERDDRLNGPGLEECGQYDLLGVGHVSAFFAEELKALAHKWEEKADDTECDLQEARLETARVKRENVEMKKRIAELQKP